jgi:hypothetical protein
MKMKSKLIAGLILAAGSLFAAPRFSVGFGFGVPAPVVPPAYVAPAYVPPCPGPDYVFINGGWEHRRPVIVHRDIVVRHDDRRDDFHRDSGRDVRR